jgi:hypothetical protein
MLSQSCETNPKTCCFPKDWMGERRNYPTVVSLSFYPDLGTMIEHSCFAKSSWQLLFSAMILRVVPASFSLFAASESPCTQPVKTKYLGRQIHCYFRSLLDLLRHRTLAHLHATLQLGLVLLALKETRPVRLWTNCAPWCFHFRY